MRIRQVALVARELDPVTDALCEALGLEVCFRDPGVAAFGLRNAVLAVGDTFLEIVSPTREGTSAGRLLERRGGDCGYMVIFETGDLAADRKRVEQAGVRVVWEIALEDVASIHLHPRDVGGAIVSLDQPRPAGSWRWGGRRWPQLTEAGSASGIAAVELAAREPLAMARRWAQVLGVGAATPLAAEGFRLELDRGAVHFVPGADAAGEGIRALELRARPGAAPREFECCGVRFRLLPEC